MFYNVFTAKYEPSALASANSDCKLQETHRCVTYRQTLMNIHNGGSEFIWLSMSFGTVKYKKSSLGYVQMNIHDGVGSQFILLLMTFVINDFWDCKTQCKPSLGYVQKPIDEHT